MCVKRKQNPIKGLYLLLHRDSKIITNDAVKARMLIKQLCSVLGKKKHVSWVHVVNCFTTHIKTESRSFLQISSKKHSLGGFLAVYGSAI